MRLDELSLNPSSKDKGALASRDVRGLSADSRTVQRGK